MRWRTFVLGTGLVVISLATVQTLGGQSASFDKLSDADRKTFQERFERELWPLLTKGGKDGCVGCHTAKAQNTLHFSGEAGKDFRMLLADGFFLADDPGNLVARVAAKDMKRRMPPGNRPPLKAEDIQLLRQFTLDLDKMQKK